MAVIVPTVTAEDPHTYRMQAERLAGFAERIHLDFMDGLFTSNKSIDLSEAWFPEGKQIDLHLMYLRPDLYMDHILLHQPSLVVTHAEAKGDLTAFYEKLQRNGIKVGVALLQTTPVAAIVASLSNIDYVLIFSGDLGHFGGDADLQLLAKVEELKKLKPTLEIGWDGGINERNVAQLVEGGVDALNVGGFIQQAADPEAAFEVLQKALAK